MLRPEAEGILRSVRPTDAAAVVERGLDVIRGDCAEVLFPLARNAARRFPGDARVQQVFGLAARGAQRSAIALEAFTAAARLAPDDPLIAHSLARAALEAGHPARALFDRAHSLAPGDGQVLLGRAAAQVQEGQATQAAADLAAVAIANPLWLEGHRSLAHLRGQLGLAPDEAISGAIRAHPRAAELHNLRINIALEARDLPTAHRAIAEARHALGDPAWLQLLDAHTTSESGNRVVADRLFGPLPVPADEAAASLHVRHLIRAGRTRAAITLLDSWEGRERGDGLWPYRFLAWRMEGDPRVATLSGDNAPIGVYDLAIGPDQLARLAGHLRAAHFATAAPLDQSVRGGTQTDGNLLLRDEPELQGLRKAALQAVDRYVAGLPPPIPRHPTLVEHRAPIRVAGSWSVRLHGQGHHADHVHSHGWISSAFYISLPASISAPGQERTDGWLSLGEARDLVPGLGSLRMIEPKPGRLVLFPSVMWHGTRPFTEGERLTVALDIAKPNQR